MTLLPLQTLDRSIAIHRKLVVIAAMSGPTSRLTGLAKISVMHKPRGLLSGIS